MKYYKLIDDNGYIGIITESDFRKYQKKHNILLVTDSKNAEYVRFNDTLYRDGAWMNPVKTSNFSYKNINIVNINEEEYKSLYDAMHFNKAIEVLPPYDEEVVEEIEEVIEEEKDVTVDYIKNTKILDMSIQCNKTITGGFNIALSDGNLYHFSLSIEDQVNLLNINNLMNNSDDKIIYHADGERCRYFSREDMQLIINKALNFKTYHTTYFNCLKAYINSLNDITTISNITYGIELPNKFTHVFLTTYKHD